MKMPMFFTILSSICLVHISIVLSSAIGVPRTAITTTNTPSTTTTTNTPSTTTTTNTPSTTTTTNTPSTTTTTTTSSTRTLPTTPYLPSFNKIIILLARYVHLQTTPSPSDYEAAITCDDPSILPYVWTNVTADSALVVSATTDCDVTVRAFTYQEIQIESVSKLDMTSYSYKGSQLKLISMGNSEIKIANIGYDSGVFTFLGNSTVTLSGSVGKLNVISRGKGTIDARSITTPNVDATLTGSGSLQVKSTTNMNLTVNGTGNVTWCSPNVQIAVTPDIYRKKSIVYQC
ncbi:unnamed protein product [Didymodactylos carnosus]|uniref:Putative auto-transporter adhesin head GIN domain-containing protein n=1 Tax=Didymodactylos carnosus TaxID=1234261 RepID=A0A8S2FIB9_9BILA|nr:unnamed protein product [Didymodactylos carnosus]CAF4268383.1 unnamed protein product [Didymodactylos carnosus]